MYVCIHKHTQNTQLHYSAKRPSPNAFYVRVYIYIYIYPVIVYDTAEIIALYTPRYHVNAELMR